MKYFSKSEKDTIKIAQNLGMELRLEKKPRKGALVLALVGELGVGKTTFVKAFLKLFGVKRRITSPTFLIMRRYGNIYHVDAYRIKDVKDLEILGFKEILNNKENLVLVEWADKVKDILPKEVWWIRFKHGEKENERSIEIE